MTGDEQKVERLVNALVNAAFNSGMGGRGTRDVEESTSLALAAVESEARAALLSALAAVRGERDEACEALGQTLTWFAEVEQMGVYDWTDDEGAQSLLAMLRAVLARIRKETPA